MRQAWQAVVGIVLITNLHGCGGKTVDGGASGPVWDQCATRTACWQAIWKYTSGNDAGLTDGGTVPAQCPPSEKFTYSAAKELNFASLQIMGSSVYHADTDTCCYLSGVLND